MASIKALVLKSAKLQKFSEQSDDKYDGQIQELVAFLRQSFSDQSLNFAANDPALLDVSHLTPPPPPHPLSPSDIRQNNLFFVSLLHAKSITVHYRILIRPPMRLHTSFYCCSRSKHCRIPPKDKYQWSCCHLARYGKRQCIILITSTPFRSDMLAMSGDS